jgi:UDP-N-acetylmuramoyl-tripeptide--D-alanyl-D-alanine ligase
VHASDKSFNNELGVPLTLANAPEPTEVTVVEMGARGRGHIALLADIARPTIGVVTAVELAHTELFGSLEAVAAAKGELVESLPAAGTAVLNADRPLVMGMAGRTSARVLTFGVDTPGVEVTAAAIEFDESLRASFELRSPWGAALVRLPIAGIHQVDNALAAAAAALAAGASPDEVAGGLGTAELSPWRMEVRRAPSGAVVINDAYNANPASAEAALRSLASLSARRRIAVLGVMAELGETAAAEHKRIAALARDLDIEVISVDAPDYGVPVVHGIDGVLAALQLEDGDAVLIKGSRVAGLEVLADALSSRSQRPGV